MDHAGKGPDVAHSCRRGLLPHGSGRAGLLTLLIYHTVELRQGAPSCWEDDRTFGVTGMYPGVVVITPAGAHYPLIM